MADNFEEQKIKLTFDTNAKQAAGDTNALGASIEHVTDSTNENTNAVKKQDAAYKTFKTQLREANAELQKSIQLYGETSEQTVKAAKAVANLKDQMGFAKDLADNFNPDQKMKALGAATQVAGTAMQGMTAGMALFGAESEDTQKQLLKVQAAMAFSDAISQMSNLGDQWKLLKTTIASSTLATKANAAATGAAAMIQNLFTGSVNASGAGFKALKLAIASTGIGLLIVGLALVVTNFQKIKDVVLKVVPGLAAVGDTVMSIVNAVTDFIGVTSEAGRAVDRMKANADASLALNKKFLAEHGSQLDEFTKQKIAAKDKYNEAIKEDGADQVALAKELNRELANIEYSRGEEERKIQADNAKKAKEDADARSKKTKEDAIKEKEDYIKAANKFEEEQAEIEFDKKQKEKEKNKKEYEEGLQEQLDKATIESEIANNLASEKKRTGDVIAQNKEDVENRMKSNSEKVLAFAASGAIKNKQIQKAAIIAEGGVNLGKSISNTAAAVASDLKLGFPANIAPIALDVATGAISAASIVSGTNKSLQALGGGSISNSGGGVQAPPQATPTVAFNNTAENQIGQSVSRSQSEQPPIKVYVAESEITDSQNNVKVLVEKNTI